MKEIVYYRQGGLRVTPHNERLWIQNDGSFKMWRSVSSASIPPSPAGWFQGKLDSEINLRLWALQKAAAASGDFKMAPPPDSVIENITLERARASLGINQQPPGHWGDMVSLLRTLLGQLSRFPRAAVDLEVRAGGQSAYLIQRGSEPIRLDLSYLKLTANLWKGENIEKRWSGTQTVLKDKAIIEAGPGWSFHLPFDHRFEISSGSHVVAYLDFNAFNGEHFVPVSLQAG
jgi:hypothetical protein